MRASAFDPPSIPPAFWERPDVCQALRKRDMGTLFTLIRQDTGLSQTRIGTAVGLGQGRISEVVNGSRGIRHAHVFERIADGLDMPDHARIMLGLPPRQIRASAPRAAPRQPGPARTPSCSGRSPRPAASTARSSASCRAKPTTSGSWTAASAHPPSQPNSKPTSATSRTACASPFARETASSSPRSWPTPPPWPDGRPSTWATCPAPGPTSSAPPPPPAKQATPACSPSPPGNRATSCWTCTARPKPSPWSGPPTTKPAPPSRTSSAAGYAQPKQKWPPPPGKNQPAATALDSAAREVGCGPAGEDLPYVALNETHLARWRGNCLVLFGDPQTADDLSTALTAMDDSFTRAEAGLRCDLAAALHVRGEQDEARQHLKRARELAQVTGSARQRRRIRDLSKRIAKAA